MVNLFLTLFVTLLQYSLQANQTYFAIEKTNSDHTMSVEQVAYNKYDNIVATASVDQSLGVWSEQLDVSGKLGLGLHEVHITVDGKTIAAQVSDLKWAYAEQKSYVIANLMGYEISVYELDETGRDVRKINTLYMKNRLVGTKSWEVVPFTYHLLIGTSTNLIRMNFMDATELWSISTNGRPRGLCLINTENLIISTGKNLQLLDTNQGNIIASQPLVESPLYIVSLAGLGSSSEAELAISLPMARLDIYIYTQISYGLVRSFKGLHGFYESRALNPIAYTDYALSVSGNYSIIIFDIKNPDNPNTRIIADSKPYNYSATSLEYLKNTNTFFVGFSGGGFENGAGYHNIRVARMTFCDDPHCINCLHRSHCKKCGIGYVLSNTSDMNACLDCANPNLQGDPMCFMSKYYLLTPITKSTSEFGSGQILAEYGVFITREYTSAMVRIAIENNTELKPLMKYNNLSPLESKFYFEIEGLTKGMDYTYRYFLRDGVMYLALNFTEDVVDKKLTMWMKNSVLLEMETTQSSVMIRNDTRVVRINGYAITGEGTIKAVGSVSKGMSSVAVAAVGVGGAFAAISLCFSAGFMTSFFSFFQVIQVKLCYSRSSRP